MRGINDGINQDQNRTHARKIDRLDLGGPRHVDRIELNAPPPPPAPPVPPPATPSPSPEIPASIRKLEKLILTAAGVSGLGMLFGLNNSVEEVARGGVDISPFTILAMQSGFILLSLAIGFAATRKHSMWARRIMKVSAVLMLVNPVLNFATVTARPEMIPFTLFFCFVGGAILYLFSRPDAKIWFMPTAPAGDGTRSMMSILQDEIGKRL